MDIQESNLQVIARLNDQESIKNLVAGGLGSLTGSLLGATIVTILLEWLRAIEEPMDFGVFEIPGIPGMRMVVFSLILLAIILFRREGIMGTREITWKTIFSLGRRKA